MEYRLIKTKEKVPRFILESGEKIFSINDVLFEILTQYKKGLNYENISIKVNEKFANKELTDKEIVEESIVQVKKMIMENIDNNHSNYINNRIKIMTGRYSESIYSFFTFLYNKYIFTISSIVFTLVSVIFFSINKIGLKEGYKYVYETLSVNTIIVAYIFFFLVIFLHEIGHATATYSFGEKPKEIGFGMYFIFPVLYTDTTNIWKLGKKERIVVNLGGIYIQLIINALLIGIYYIYDTNVLIKVLIVMNTVSIITSFNPFFRYDGYWIYSDLFEISNLKEKTFSMTKVILSQPKKILKNIRYSNKALMIYVILNFIFWIMVSYSMLVFFINSIGKISEFISTGNWLSFSMMKIIISFVMIGVFGYNILTKLKKYGK